MIPKLRLIDTRVTHPLTGATLAEYVQLMGQLEDFALERAGMIARFKIIASREDDIWQRVNQINAERPQS